MGEAHAPSTYCRDFSTCQKIRNALRINYVRVARGLHPYMMHGRQTPIYSRERQISVSKRGFRRFRKATIYSTSYVNT